MKISQFRNAIILAAGLFMVAGVNAQQSASTANLTPEQQKAKKTLEEALVCDRDLKNEWGEEKEVEVDKLSKKLGATVGKEKKWSDEAFRYGEHSITFKSPSLVQIRGYEVTKVFVEWMSLGYTYTSTLAVTPQDFYKAFGLKAGGKYTGKPKLEGREFSISVTPKKEVQAVCMYYIDEDS